ncbi:MAG: tRNA uridine(34) 5-carboxymethylaminomethyl modification radical SAM/GNAT enzyme Elp3, partial [Nitrososphaerales archaeon]
EREVDLMLKYGATRVEVGVQTLDDEVYRLVKRGHTVKDVAYAFRTAKDSGLKVVAHMMPGLPGSSPERDLESFHSLFEDADFKPDMLKIYPTLVVKSAELYRWWLNRDYTPYDLETTVKLLADVKRSVPSWMRIMRIQRDIPARLIEAGVKKSNLRELVQKEVHRRGYSCRCIRCREIGLKRPSRARPDESNIEMKQERYDASDGEEIFLSFIDGGDDALVGFVRIRNPSEHAHRREVNSSRCCLVRELHIYGPVVPIGLKDDNSWQHRGFGRRLMEGAERISKEEFDAEKIIVMSAVGTRMYYRKLRYRLEGPYMVKDI